MRLPGDGVLEAVALGGVAVVFLQNRRELGEKLGDEGVDEAARRAAGEGEAEVERLEVEAGERGRGGCGDEEQAGGRELWVPVGELAGGEEQEVDAAIGELAEGVARLAAHETGEGTVVLPVQAAEGVAAAGPRVDGVAGGAGGVGFDGLAGGEVGDGGAGLEGDEGRGTKGGDEVGDERKRAGLGVFLEMVRSEAGDGGEVGDHGGTAF